MNTQPMSLASLSRSVIAVPPIARDADLQWNVAENVRMIRHLERGGVTTLLYGGNAALAHVSVSEYATMLTWLSDAAASTTFVIPSVGPSYGLMMDQGAILRDFSFPTVMLLPSRDGVTSAGVAAGLRRFVDRLAKPVVLYLKYDNLLDVETIRRMVNDGLISWIKYGITRENPRQDPYLKGLVEAVGPGLIVSGMGEQPAIIHLREFGLTGFTSGCVCIAPRLSMNLLSAIQSNDDAAAEAIRQQFLPMETLRDKINPVRVLHAAVALAGIAETGPITPFWSPIDAEDVPAIQKAAFELLQLSPRS